MEELGFYILSVKAMYLLLVSVYYSSKNDPKRVKKEFESFNIETHEILKHAHLIDIYEGDETDGCRGTMFFKGGDTYEGYWVNDDMSGHEQSSENKTIFGISMNSTTKFVVVRLSIYH